RQASARERPREPRPPVRDDGARRARALQPACAALPPRRRRRAEPRERTQGRGVRGRDDVPRLRRPRARGGGERARRALRGDQPRRKDASRRLRRRARAPRVADALVAPRRRVREPPPPGSAAATMAAETLRRALAPAG